MLLLAVFGGYVGPFGGYVGPLAGYVGPFGGHAKTMFSNVCMMFGNLWLLWRFWGLCWAVWGLCGDSVGQLGALLAASEGYVGPFGGYILTMLGSLGLCWLFLKAMLGHSEAMLGLCSTACGSVESFCRLC